MEEKVFNEGQDKLKVEKKVYSTPFLIVYGKLAELTAAGTGPITESAGKMMNDPAWRVG